DDRGSPFHWRTGRRAHSGLPPGGSSFKTVLGSVVRVLYLVLACCAGLGAAQKPNVQQLRVQIAMRDGIRLAANVYLPAEHGRLPTILERTPYGKGAEVTAGYQYFVDHGYAVVVQD